MLHQIQRAINKVQSNCASSFYALSLLYIADVKVIEQRETKIEDQIVFKLYGFS